MLNRSFIANLAKKIKQINIHYAGMVWVITVIAVLV